MIDNIPKSISDVIVDEWPDQIPEGGLKLDTKIFYEGVELDSVDGVTLILSLEEKFGIEFNQAELSPEVFETIGTLAAYLQKQINGQRKN